MLGSGLGNKVRSFFLKGFFWVFLGVFLAWIWFNVVYCPCAHVVVLDQNENPVKGVLVRSNVQEGNAFFFSDETTVKYTDAQGKVLLPVGPWFEITLVEKDGYQFRTSAQFQRDYGSYTFGRSAKRFSKEKPLVIRAWRRSKQQDLEYVGGWVRYPDSQEKCTLELVKPTKENGLEAPITWSFDLKSDYVPARPELTKPWRKYVAESWTAWMRVTDAQLIDTGDLFLNEAPESGYEDKVSVGPYPRGRGSEIKNNETRYLYIKDQRERFYGAGLVFLWPDTGTKAEMDEVNNEGAKFQFWFNLRGSRNVMRDKAHTTWRTTSDWMEDRHECLENQ